VVDAGVYAIQLGNDASVRGSEFSAEDEWQVVPHVYYAQPVDERLVWGFGLNSPFGLGTDWGRATPVSPVITEARLMHLSATGALGWQVTDEWSLGASLAVNYSDLTLEQGLGFPGSFLRFEGDDVSVGGALATRWQPHEQHALGLLVSLETSQKLDGTLRSTVQALGGPAEFDFMTPLRVAAGYSFRPARGWNLEAGIEWLDWDSLDTLMLTAPSLPGGGQAVSFNWESMFIYELGVSYTTEDNWVFAAGYDYNSNAQPDTYYTPGVADADRHWFNVGFGRHEEGWNWFLTYQFGYSNRTVSNATGVNALANGKYEARHHAVVFTWEHPF
jgi:long-chain fatty acid transport protein